MLKEWIEGRKQLVPAERRASGLNPWMAAAAPNPSKSVSDHFDTSLRGAVVGGATSVITQLPPPTASPATAAEFSAPTWTSERYAQWLKTLPTRSASGSKPENIFQRQVAGPTEYHVQGINGKWIWLDGIERNTAVEAKMVVTPRSSAQVGSGNPFFQAKYDAWINDEFARIKDVLLDESNPLSSVEVRVNTRDAVAYYETLLSRMRIPGNVLVTSERGAATAVGPLVPAASRAAVKPGVGLAEGIALGIVASLAEAGVAKEVYHEHAAMLEDLLSQLSIHGGVDEAGWDEIGRRLHGIQNMKQSTFGGVWEFITYGQNSITEQRGLALGLLAHELAQKYGYKHSRTWGDIAKGRPGRFFKRGLSEETPQ